MVFQLARSQSIVVFGYYVSKCLFPCPWIAWVKLHDNIWVLQTHCYNQKGFINLLVHITGKADFKHTVACQRAGFSNKLPQHRTTGATRFWDTQDETEFAKISYMRKFTVLLYLRPWTRGASEKPCLINSLATSFHCGQQKVIMHSSPFQSPPLVHGLKSIVTGALDTVTNTTKAHWPGLLQYISN